VAIFDMCPFLSPRISGKWRCGGGATSIDNVVVVVVVRVREHQTTGRAVTCSRIWFIILWHKEFTTVTRIEVSVVLLI
jgi:hypothetical protein